MRNNGKQISSFWYYFLLSSLTNLAFILVGVVIIALFSINILDIFIGISIIVLVWKGALASFVIWIVNKKMNTEMIPSKFIGLYLGRFYGVILGGFIGSRIANLLNIAGGIGSIVGALTMYFAGRWIGSKASAIIAYQLNRVVTVAEKTDEKIVKSSITEKSLLFWGMALLPFLYFGIGVLMKYAEIPMADGIEFLPIARITIIGISIFTIWYPWRMRKRWLVHISSKTSSPPTVISWLGSIFSLIPAIFGFILFFGMGASIVELFFFSIASSVAIIIWSANRSGLSDW